MGAKDDVFQGETFGKRSSVDGPREVLCSIITLGLPVGTCVLGTFNIYLKREASEMTKTSKYDLGNA